MDRDRRPLTASEKIEMDLMAEAELEKLQRQYRIMEGDRKAFADETNLKLAKQRQLIKDLEARKQDLLVDLQIAASVSNRKKDAALRAHMDEKLDRHDRNDEEIVRERTRLEEVEQQILKMEKQISGVRDREVTEVQRRERIRSGRKQITTLENQLENEIKRFCSLLNSNRVEREEICHLIKERARFNQVWLKLLADLEQGKKTILDLIEQATIAFDQREEWRSKLQALKFRNQNDSMLHIQEMKELERELDYDHKLYEFLGIKSQKRVMRDLEEKEAQKREAEKAKEEEQVEQKRDMLKKIQEMVEESDVDKLVSQYLKREEENFALFNYVNELNHEIEVLMAEIKKLREEIEKQRQLKEVRVKQQKETFESLSDDLKKVTESAEMAKKNLQDTEREVNYILLRIKRFFDLVKCNTTPVLQLLGQDANINPNNVTIYLAVLEKRVVELTSHLQQEKRHGRRRRIAIREKKD